MDELIEYLVKEITGLDDVTISKEEDDNYINFTINAPADSVGLIIGKNGKTIKTMRRLLKVRATLEKKKVDLTVSEA